MTTAIGSGVGPEEGLGSPLAKRCEKLGLYVLVSGRTSLERR